jgi:hypothetical protein
MVNRTEGEWSKVCTMLNFLLSIWGSVGMHPVKIGGLKM